MSSDKEHTGEYNPSIAGAQAQEITDAGALGLLALGAAGIKAWRKKREEEKLKTQQKEHE